MKKLTSDAKPVSSWQGLGFQGFTALGPHDAQKLKKAYPEK